MSDNITEASLLALVSAVNRGIFSACAIENNLTRINTDEYTDKH